MTPAILLGHVGDPTEADLGSTAWAVATYPSAKVRAIGLAPPGPELSVGMPFRDQEGAHARATVMPA